MNEADNKPKVERKAGPRKKTSTCARSMLRDIVHSTAVVLVDERKVVFEDACAKDSISEQSAASLPPVIPYLRIPHEQAPTFCLSVPQAAGVLGNKRPSPDPEQIQNERCGSHSRQGMTYALRSSMKGEEIGGEISPNTVLERGLHSSKNV